MKSEKRIQNEIRAALDRTGKVRLYRNNVGKLPDGNGGWIVFGLAIGSADLVGIMKPTGRFFCIECKSATGTVGEHQEIWLRTIRSYGGVAEVARSADEALDILRRAETGLL